MQVVADLDKLLQEQWKAQKEDIKHDGGWEDITREDSSRSTH